jgi:general secretion pathway protein K
MYLVAIKMDWRPGTSCGVSRTLFGIGRPGYAGIKLLYRLLNPLGFFAFKMGRLRGGPSRTGAQGAYLAHSTRCRLLRASHPPQMRRIQVTQGGARKRVECPEQATARRMGQIAVLRSRLEKQPADLRRNPRDLGVGTLMRHAARHPSGSALLLVLFAIILLTGLITATVAFVSNDVDEYGVLNKEFRARQLAESGLAFGIDPQVTNQDRALLDQKMPDQGAFHVLISSESTKLNINFILQSGRDDLLTNLFVRWGVAPKTADAAVEGLHNYLSKPLSTQPASGDANTLQAAAQNQTLFGAVAEMSLVPEFGAVMRKQPDWANFFTIWGDGKLDVNLADADAIALITGVSAATADKFVKYRWGFDGKPYTADDRIYNSMDEVRAGLGMSAEQFQLVQDFLSLTSSVDRIESTGTIAGYQKQIVVVTSRDTLPITYLSWQEK